MGYWSVLFDLRMYRIIVDTWEQECNGLKSYVKGKNEVDTGV